MRTVAVERFDNRLRRDDGDVVAAIGDIDDLFGVPERPATVQHAGRFMALSVFEAAKPLWIPAARLASEIAPL